MSEFRERWLSMVDLPSADTTRSELISGMKQGINDILRMLSRCPADLRKRIDDTLAAKGLPSLRAMEDGLKRKHQGILARGQIQNDEEYYIVAGILNDMDFEITETDRRKLEEISAAYGADEGKPST